MKAVVATTLARNGVAKYGLERGWKSVWRTCFSGHINAVQMRPLRLPSTALTNPLREGVSTCASALFSGVTVTSDLSNRCLEGILSTQESFSGGDS
jgi:hypothetical protein